MRKNRERTSKQPEYQTDDLFEPELLSVLVSLSSRSRVDSAGAENFSFFSWEKCDSRLFPFSFFFKVYRLGSSQQCASHLPRRSPDLVSSALDWRSSILRVGKSDYFRMENQFEKKSLKNLKNVSEATASRECGDEESKAD